jgi:hypothetical protein
MSRYRITHIDRHRQCRRMRVLAGNRLQALAEVERKFGHGWFVAAVRLGVSA